MTNWLRVFDPPHPYLFIGLYYKFPSPLYYSLLLGFADITEWLLKAGTDINAQGGNFGNALQAVAYNGYEALVRLLREKGANFNV